VTEGRRAEFAGFGAFSGEQVPDPQDPYTFARSKLQWGEREQMPHAGILRLYHEVLDLRARLPALRGWERGTFIVIPVSDTALAMRRMGDAPDETLLLIVNLRGALRLELARQPQTAPPNGWDWTVLLDSEEPCYGGLGDTQFVAAGEGGPTIGVPRAGAVVLSVAQRLDTRL
jgi:maltooligosyltrehalose trehalohydrolase